MNLVKLDRVKADTNARALERRLITQTDVALHRNKWSAI
jgi:hypothetical protein